MMNIELKPLINYCQMISRGITPKYTDHKSIWVINQKCIRENRVSFADARFHDGQSKTVPEQKFVKKWDILVNSTGTGTLGRTAQYKDELENVTVDSHVTIVRPSEQIYPAFLGYALQYRQPNIEALAEGSTGQTELSRTRLGDEITIPVFNYKEQMRIADTLSALDARIDNNKQINHNLEAQAQAIFKSWFVDFEPFQNGKFIDSELGSIPEGWRAGTLKEMLDIRYGKDHKKLSAGTIPVYGSGGLMRLADKALYSGESVLIPRKGTLNNVMRVSGDFWTVDTMFYSVPKCKGAIKFAFHVLRNMDLASMNSGSAVPSMTTDILNSIDIVVPPESVLASFEETTSALWNLDEANLRESNRLASLRDALLPKLMSGEIDVSEVEV